MFTAFAVIATNYLAIYKSVRIRCLSPKITQSYTVTVQLSTLIYCFCSTVCQKPTVPYTYTSVSHCTPRQKMAKFNLKKKIIEKQKMPVHPRRNLFHLQQVKKNKPSSRIHDERISNRPHGNTNKINK